MPLYRTRQYLVNSVIKRRRGGGEGREGAQKYRGKKRAMGDHFLGQICLPLMSVPPSKGPTVLWQQRGRRQQTERERKKEQVMQNGTNPIRRRPTTK